MDDMLSSKLEDYYECPQKVVNLKVRIQTNKNFSPRTCIFVFITQNTNLKFAVLYAQEFKVAEHQ